MKINIVKKIMVYGNLLSFIEDSLSDRHSCIILRKITKLWKCNNIDDDFIYILEEEIDSMFDSLYCNVKPYYPFDFEINLRKEIASEEIEERIIDILLWYAHKVRHDG